MNPKYKLLNDSLEALKKGSINLLCLSGAPGFGKSYDTLNFLQNNKISHTYQNTYSSPMAFYKSLYDHKDKEIIVFDDVQNLDNPIIISILKSACWGVINNKRIVGWHTTSESFNKLEIPAEFELKANIVLIFNGNLKDFEAIINRSINIKFEFSYKDKINIFRNLSLDEEIINFIESTCSEATENLSIRTIVILIRLKNDGFNWRDFAREILNYNEDDYYLVELIKCKRPIKEACKEWVEKTGFSERTFFRKYRKLFKV